MGDFREGPPIGLVDRMCGNAIEPPKDAASSMRTIRWVVMCIVRLISRAIQEPEAADGRGNGVLPSKRSSMLVRTSVSTSPSCVCRRMRPDGDSGADARHVSGDHLFRLSAAIVLVLSNFPESNI